MLPDTFPLAFAMVTLLGARDSQEIHARIRYASDARQRSHLLILILAIENPPRFFAIYQDSPSPRPVLSILPRRHGPIERYAAGHRK